MVDTGLTAGAGRVRDDARGAAFSGILPVPASVRPAPGEAFALTRHATVYTERDSARAAAVGDHLAGLLRRSTGFDVPVVPAPAGEPAPGISLLLAGAPASGGGEGYQLDVTAQAVVLRAQAPAGLFAGVQTLRQLLPPEIESPTVHDRQWWIPAGRVVDHPRFAYRGAMLDVARHFFSVAQVKRYIDQLALYKINHLHLHLSDDQGWRVMIESWPRLATFGGETAVGGDPGGYYTQAEYAEIVAYAGDRFMTVVPEIDVPGHVNAALASYPELNADGVAPPRYTGTGVGFSSLSAAKDVTYRFVDDVVRELAALTPGPYLHIGGDEADATAPADYKALMDRVQEVVAAHGKQAVAWHQIVGANPAPSTVVQFWDPTDDYPAVAAAARGGTRLVLSPAHRAYLDMKYTPATELGQDWAGCLEVGDAYGWDPGTFLHGVEPSSVFGVEAPLWTETLRTSADLEFMAFPRLAAIAELGWSPAHTHSWTAFRKRLAAQGPRWRVMDVAFHRSPQVPWR